MNRKSIARIAKLLAEVKQQREDAAEVERALAESGMSPELQNAARLAAGALFGNDVLLANAAQDVLKRGALPLKPARPRRPKR